QLGHEAGQPRAVQRREHAPDVDLREVVVHDVILPAGRGRVSFRGPREPGRTIPRTTLALFAGAGGTGIGVSGRGGPSTANERKAARAGPPRADGATSGSQRPSTTP